MQVEIVNYRAAVSANITNVESKMNSDSSISIVNKDEGGKSRRTSVITYRRVSTPTQKQNGVSLEDQQQQLEAFAEANNLRIVVQFSDAHSARGEQERSERPGFNDACKLALKND
jgi:hypothetical protein